MMPARGVSSVPVKTPASRVGRHVKLPLTTSLHVVTKFRMTLFFSSRGSDNLRILFGTSKTFAQQ